MAVITRMPGEPLTPAPNVATLTAADVPRLRLRHAHHEREVIDQVEAFPGRSVWIPETLEYLVVTPWRHRYEIAHVEDMEAARHAEALTTAAAERCANAGDALFLTLDILETRPDSFYEASGLQCIEEILTYDLPRHGRAVSAAPALRVIEADPRDPEHLTELRRLDHAAFPWLWQNSDDEFRHYRGVPGVRIGIGMMGGRAVSYFGVTAFSGWGHLDRIAVDPSLQGRGVGRETLARATEVLFSLGAQRVGLSTQSTNTISQRLYESYGFHRTPAHDYRLYGRLLPAHPDFPETVPTR